MKPVSSLLHHARMVPSHTGGTNWLEAPALALLIAVPVVAPLAYGAIQPGGTLAVELLVFSSAALAFASGSPRRPLGAALVPLMAVLAIAALGVAQLAPLPERV